MRSLFSVEFRPDGVKPRRLAIAPATMKHISPSAPQPGWQLALGYTEGLKGGSAGRADGGPDPDGRAARGVLRGPRARRRVPLYDREHRAAVRRHWVCREHAGRACAPGGRRRACGARSVFDGRRGRAGAIHFRSTVENIAWPRRVWHVRHPALDRREKIRREQPMRHTPSILVS